MSKISEVGSIFPLLDEVTERTKGCKTLEDAAQVVTDVLYEEFSDSVILVRFFATVPFGELPAANRSFVAKLADRQNITNLIKDETLVLSLLGTRGTEPAWNNRRRSEGHVGIPLASADFIDRIPMMSRLAKEVGLNLGWIDRQEAIVIKTFAGLSGVFYVPDAKTAVDDQGRKIISAGDFVRDYNVETVFGLATGYPVSKTFLTLIAFCRETIEKSKIEQFLPLISYVKAGTTSLVSTGAIFA
jgi:hypothetical protein